MSVIYLDFHNGAIPKAISKSYYGIWVLEEQLFVINANEDTFFFSVQVPHTVDNLCHLPCRTVSKQIPPSLTPLILCLLDSCVVPCSA
jgi:hypothetical protein